ncbi:MAG: MFS transporter [Pseudomonadota bacterium]
MTATHGQPGAEARTHSLAAAMLCAALAGCGFGLLMPLVSLNLEAMTGSAAIAGGNAAMAALSTIILTPFAPGLLAAMRPRLAIILALIITGLGIALFPFIADVTAWFILRFLVGVSMTFVFVASETWINQLAKPERRASLLAVYATVLAGGFGLGGVLVALLGASGFAPWLVGAGIFLLGAVPIIALRGPELEAPLAAEARPSALFSAARIAPLAMLAGFIFGALETSSFALFPVYAERLGFPIVLIGLLTTAGALGAIGLQVPIGMIADRVGRRRILFLVALASTLAPLGILASGASAPPVFVLTFFYVGCASAFYTLGLALVGERFTGGSMAAANAAFILAYGAGSLVGPLSGGAAMDIWSPFGLMPALSALALIYVLLSALSSARGR